MSPLNIALKYMEVMFSESDPDQLRPLFGEDFVFEGPFYTFTTAEAYINSLKADPPVAFKYEILKSWEDNHSACLIYQFSKPGISIPMSQWFGIENGKINKILLIFDSSPFMKHKVDDKN